MTRPVGSRLVDGPRWACDVVDVGRTHCGAGSRSGVGYGWGVARVRSRGIQWPVRRAAAWLAGTASLLLITVGGLGAHAHTLLWVYTVQVLVLLLGTPVLLAYGRPLALAADALPERVAARVLN